MGEDGKKQPKVEGKKPHWVNHKKHRSAGEKRSAFRAPTLGLEDKFFTVGDS